MSKTFTQFIEETCGDKESKSHAKYQGEPKGNQKCSNCTMWRPPHGCTKVMGKIAKDGWCKYWQGKEDS